MNSNDLSVTRVRHALKTRLLRVARVQRPTPHLVRVTLAGPELRDFVSASFDDHVKVFLPEPGADRPAMPVVTEEGLSFPEGQPRPPMRDYTPRRHDPRALELDLEFVLHAEGPATTWAAQAQPGQYLGIGGPRGSFVVPMTFDWHLLIGDESALPAIARRLEELPAGKRAIALIEAGSEAARIDLRSRADAQVRWLVREGAESGLSQAARELELPAGEGYVWVAAESAAARAVREVMVGERGVAKHRIRASSYWKRGAVAVHETHED